MDSKKTFQPEDKNKGLAQKAGDAIERVGQKASEAGATKAGKAIYNAGDKIEHSRDKK
jgi:hypothetical protein